MRKINRKRLNNKGFTLVELLAVVVILAVVMGIAATAVLSSMNNSRKGSLQNSAKSVAQAFQTKYSESMVTGTTAKIYETETGVAYNFNMATTTDPEFYYLNDKLKDELNLSPSIYELDNAATVNGVDQNAAGTVFEPKYSFVAFDGKSVVVCLIANKSGSYYVANFTTKTSATVLGETVDFGSSANNMWSCSTDGVNSWT